MAIIQISKIQHRTGANVDLPQLAEGELGFATDERRLYIGNDPNLYPPSGNSLTTQTEILTEVSVLNWSKIGGTANTQIGLNGPVGNGQVLVANANTWVNAGGTSNIKIDLGSANNVVLRGGLNGYVLTTDGTGNLTWEGTGVGTFRIQDISKANPAVVTTINDNTVVTGIPLTIIGVSGMTQISTAGENGTNKYYGVKLTNKTFSLYSDPSLANAVNSTGFTPATPNTGNIICSFYQAGTGVPGGANTQIQFQDTAGLFGGSANLTFNKDTNNLALNGNANITRITTTLVTSANLIGSIGLGAGNANPGNFTAITANSTISATGNITGGNLRTTGQISAGGVITTAGLNTLGNANIGNLSLTGVVKGDLIPQDDLQQNLGSPTQRWKELYLSGNTIYLGNTSITANADGISSNVISGENANIANTVYANFISGTLLANSSSQPNITTVGTLTGLSVQGITDLGDVSNVRITGGYPDYVLQTDGLGNLAWNPVVLPDIVAGNTNQIQYNVNDGLAASANLTFNPATSTLQSVTISATGNLNSANLNVSNNIISNANIRGATISSTGTILANGNIQGANLIANTLISTLGNVSANVLNANSASILGNVRAGNLNSVNVVSANGTISGANISTTGNVSANGNVTGANLLTTGNVSATGTVIGQQINSENISVSGNIISNNLIINNEISTTGNITSDNYILGNGAFLTGINLGNQSGLNQIVNGSSNVSIPSVNGDVRIGSGGTANVVRVTNTGLTVTGNITANGSLSVGSLSSGVLSANGSVTGANLLTAGALSVGGNANVGPLGVAGALSAGGAVSAASISAAGQIVTNSNITAQNANLGNLARANFFQGDGSLLTNLTIGAGTQLLNGSSNVVVAANGAITISSGNVNNVQVVTNQGVAVSGTHSTTGSVTGGNLFTAGNVSASGNVLANNVTIVGTLSASGNLLGLNVNAAGNLSVTGNISTTSNITAAGNLIANNATLGNANILNVLNAVGIVASGNVAAGNLNATGNLSVLSNVNANSANLTGNITAAGNLTIQNIAANNVSASGTITGANATLGNAVTANFFLGNIRGNLFNGTSGVNIAAPGANVTVSVNNTSNVVVISQNTLAVTGALSVTGVSNLNTVNANTATITTVNATTLNSSVVCASGNIQGANLNTAGILSVTGNANLTNVNISGSLSTTGNVTGGNLITTGVISTTSDVVTDELISNIATITGNATAGNIVTGGLVTATGLIRGGNISAVANIFAGNVVSANNLSATSNLTVGNLANVGNLIATGNISAFSNLKSNNVNANNLLINSAATINSLAVSSFVLSDLIPNANATYNLGTPTNNYRSLAVSNVGITIGQTSLTSNVNELTITAGNTTIPSAIISDLAVGNYANLGDVGNLRIFGGNSNDVITTNGNGNISFANLISIVPAAGGNTEIQFNDNGTFNGSSSLRFYKSNGVTSGTFAGNASRLFGIAGANVTGQVANALVAGTVTIASQANITAVGNLSSLSVVGNIKVGNASLGNLANANFLSGRLITANQPNITDLGSLNNLTVSNIDGVVNFEYTSNVTLGTISNLHIAGGSNGQFLTTDGVGNLSWSNPVASGVANGLSNMTIEQNGNIAFQVAGFANRFRIEQSTFSSNVQGLFYEPVNFFAPVSLGTIGNVRILGGQTGQVLTTTGAAGQIGWASAPATQSIVNGNSNVIVGLNTNIRVSVNGTPNVTQFTNTGIITSIISATGIVNTGLASLGNISNVKILGGSAGQIIQTDGTGNLSYVAAPISSILANGQSNVSIDLSGNVRTSVAGTPNVLVVANTGITVTGISNLGSNTNVKITGGAVNQLLSTDGTGNLSWVASPPTFVISNGTSNLTVNQNGNIIANVTGTLNALQIGNTGITVGGFVSATGNIVTDISRLKVTGGIANQVLSVVDTSGNLAFTALPPSNQIVGGSSNVTVNPSANVVINVAGVPNVLQASPTGVRISGDLQLTGNANLSSADALNIPGGNPGDILSTDGTGNLSFVAPSVGTAIVNGSSNVRIPGSASNITFGVSGTQNVFVLSTTLANLTGNLSVTGSANINSNINLGLNLSAAGNVTGQNLRTPGTISATGGISTAQNLSVTGSTSLTGQLSVSAVNLTTLLNGPGSISISGNINGNNIIGGNLSTTGDISGANIVASANANVGNLYATNLVSATGNIASGNNITAGGFITAIGNITADRFIGNGALLTNVSANVSRIANGTSNVSIPTVNGNIGFTVGGANVITVSSGNFIVATPESGMAGNLSVFENITAGGRLLAACVTATGNVTATYLLGNGAFLTGINNEIYNNANVATYLPTYTGNLGNVNNINAAGIVNTSGLVTSYLSISSATTLNLNKSGSLVDLTNSGYQIALPNPIGNPGVNYTFRLRQLGQSVTLATPSGTFEGSGYTGSGTINITYNIGQYFYVYSDGTKYIISARIEAEAGAGLRVRTNIPATSTTTGALVVTGGIGVSGNIYSGSSLVVSGGLTLGATFTAPAASLTQITGNIFGRTTANIIIENGDLASSNIVFRAGGAVIQTITPSNVSVVGNVIATSNVLAGSNVIAPSVSATGSLTTPTVIVNTITSNSACVANSTTNIFANNANAKNIRATESFNVNGLVTINSTGEITNVNLLRTSDLSVTGIATIVSLNSTVNISSGNTIVANGAIHARANASAVGNQFRVGNSVWLGDRNVTDTLAVRGQINDTTGYITFGSDSTARLGRSGTAPLTWNSDFSVTGTVKATNLEGNLNVGNSDIVANSFTSTNFYGGNFAGRLTATVSGSGNIEMVRASIAGPTNPDYFSIEVGGTTQDRGYVAFNTGDNGTEQIYFRQYNGATKANEVTLLDEFGNSIFSGNISAVGNVKAGNFVGNLTASVAGGQTANIINATMGGSDSFRLQLGGSTEQGIVAFDVAEELNEQIIFRQFQGTNFQNEIRRVTLLDTQGNARFPNTVSATGFLGSSVSVSGAITAGTISGTISTTGSVTAGTFLGNVDAATGPTGYINSPTYTGTNIFVTGVVSTTGNANVGNLFQIGATGVISAAGSVVGRTFAGNLVGTTACVTDYSGTSVSISGNITASNFISTSTGTGNNYRVGTRAFIGDINIADTVIIKGNNNPANGYIVFGTGNNLQTLGRAGTGPLTYTGNFSTTGSITADEFVGNFDIGNSDVIANSFAANNFYGGDFFGRLTTNTITGSNSFQLISSNIADNDWFRVTVGGSGTNQGNVEFATGDDGNEPIYFRQYTGSSVTNEVILLDQNGNSVFKNVNATNVTATQFVGPLVANAAGTTGATDIIRGTMALNDGARVQIFGEGSGLGSLAIDTTDGSSTGRWTPILVRQYQGAYTGAPSRTLTLLDSTGNTQIPGILSVTGEIRGSSGGSITGILSTGTLSASATVSTPSLTGTNISVTGTISAGGIVSTGLLQGQTVSATGQILSSTNITAGGTVSAIGNVIAGNVRASGNITATGNVTAVANVYAASLFGNLSATSAVINSVTGTTSSVTGNVTGGVLISTATGTGQNFKVGATGWIGDIGVTDTLIVNSQANAANGYVVFGNGNNLAKLGRAGTGPLTYSGDMSLTGNVTATNFIGNINIGSSDLAANNLTLTSNLSVGGSITTTGSVNAASINGNLVTSTVSTGSANVVLATMALPSPDYFRIQVGSNGSDQGWVSFDTADNGNEPIIFRQYVSGGVGVPFGSPLREAILLDSAGNTVLPGSLNVGTNISVAGGISASGTINAPLLSVTGNISTGNNISATGNVNVSTNLSVVSSITGGSILSQGTLSAVGAISTPSTISATGIISATANIRSSANLVAGANVYANSGNVYTNSVIGTVVSMSGSVTAASLIGNLSATSAVITSATGTSSSVTGTVTGSIIISTATSTGQNFRVGTTTWLGDIGVTETLMISSQTNAANGYVVFGNGNNLAKLGRAGTGPLTYSGDMSLTGTITASSLIGTITTGQDITANNLTASNNVTGANLIGLLTCANLTGTNNANLILANIATSDYFRLTVGGTSADNGFVSFDIGDNGNEPIYFRQYNGPTPRTLTLLDATGNTQLPGNLSLSGSITTTGNVTANTFTGNLQISLSGSNTANIISTTIADNDYFRIQVGGIGSNGGFVSFDTANEGTEPIYFRQYLSTQIDPYPNPPVRTLTLLDGTGNTLIPGVLSANGNVLAANLSTAGNVFANTFVTQPLASTSNANVVYGQIASNDFYRIQVGGTATDGGFLSIDTANNGDEPIYVRQYTDSGGNPFGTKSRELTLLDSGGNTILPGNLSIQGTNSVISVAGGVGNYAIGVRGYPVKSISTSYTVTINDPSVTLYFSGQSGGTQLNIPTNTTAALPLGTEIRIINGDAAQNITVVPALGVTMIYQGSSGSRTLSTYADTSLIKVGTNTWFINGYGIT